jgi:hypothetical protein
MVVVRSFHCLWSFAIDPFHQSRDWRGDLLADKGGRLCDERLSGLPTTKPMPCLCLRFNMEKLTQSPITLRTEMLP